MEYHLPHRISGERDLKEYENYLKNDNSSSSHNTHEITVYSNENTTKVPTKIQGLEHRANLSRNNIMPDTVTNPIFFQGYLKNHIGKLIKVESLIGDCLETRVGILLEVGADYIVIKLYRGCSSMMIQAANVKYITIIHDNDINKTGLY